MKDGREYLFVSVDHFVCRLSVRNEIGIMECPLTMEIMGIVRTRQFVDNGIEHGMDGFRSDESALKKRVFFVFGEYVLRTRRKGMYVHSVPTSYNASYDTCKKKSKLSKFFWLDTMRYCKEGKRVCLDSWNPCRMIKRSSKHTK